MIDDIDHADYYPIDIERTDAAVEVTATYWTHEGHEHAIVVTLSRQPAVTRRDVREAYRLARAYLRGTVIEVRGEDARCYRLPPGHGTQSPLAGAV